MWILYQLAVAALTLAASPLLLVARGRHYRQSVRRRLGLYRDRDGAPPARPGALWIHAVSVGEVGVAAAWARTLPQTLPLVVTTITPTGQARARAAFPSASVTYLPFDLGFAVGRFFRRFQPAALVLTEGDLWPLVLRQCRRRRLPVVVINGRVSDRSFRRMRRLTRWLGPLFAPVDRFAVQSDADRDRLVALGVRPERITVTGNLKFETTEPAADAELERGLEALAAGRPILVAGSTMRGEEEAVLRAFQEAGGGEAGLLVLAPRHPERWEAVDELLERSGIPRVRRSRLRPGEGGDNGERPAVMLLDSMGELASLYRLARGAFIGGTLVPTGGHNPVEAARHGVPVAVGPSMENFREIAGLFDGAKAWRRVEGSGELAAAWKSWIADGTAARALGERGAELAARHRGALERTLAATAPAVAAAEHAAGADRGA